MSDNKIYYELDEYDGKRLCYSGLTTDFEKVKEWVKKPDRLWRVFKKDEEKEYNQPNKDM